jgi:hypothetical protein
MAVIGEFYLTVMAALPRIIAYRGYVEFMDDDSET